MSGIIAANSFGVETTLPAKAKSVPNLDPNFLISTATGDITTGDISERPYLHHIWTNASCRVINKNVSKLPKVLCKESDPEEYITEHEVLELFKRPNPWMSGIGFWQAIVLGLLLPSKRRHITVDSKGQVSTGNENLETGGQVFLVGLKGDEYVNFQKGEMPDAIFPYTDQQIAPYEKKDKKGLVRLEGWVLVDNNGSKIAELGPENVIRIYHFNPYEWTRGVSDYYPTAMAMADDIKSDIYNTQSFENDGTVAGTLETEQDLTDDQYAQYYRRWMGGHGGVGRNNTIAVLGRGLKYNQIGLSQADMQFSDQKKFNFEKFAAGYGLNKIAYGKYEEINFATIKEGRKLLWQDTYKPLDELITMSITQGWTEFIDGGLILKSDYSGIEYLRQDYTTRAKAAGVMVKELRFTPYYAAKLNNIPITEDIVDKYPWLDEEPPQKQAGPAIPPEKQVANKVEKSFKKGQKLTPDERTALSWDFIHKVLDPGEKEWKKELDRFFNSQRNRMQDKVDMWLKKQKAMPEGINKGVYLTAYWKQLIVTPSEFMLNAAEENEKLLKVLRPLIAKQMRRDAARLEQELGTLIDFTVTNETIDTYIEARKQQIKDINTTTFKKANKKIGAVIEEAINDNLTPQETAKKIKGAIAETGEVRKNQALTIARTETATISNTTRFVAFRQEGIEYHEWLTAGDERVREDHSLINGEIVKIGQTFPVVNIKYPTDPNGAPGQIINCRCITIPAEAPKG